MGQLDYGPLMTSRVPSAQERAEVVLAQIEAAVRIAQSVRAPESVLSELRRIHLLLHQRGLSHDAQGTLF